MKRLLCILLAAVVLLVAGCGSTGNTQESSPESPETQESPALQEPDAEPLEEPEESVGSADSVIIYELTVPDPDEDPLANFHFDSDEDPSYTLVADPAVYPVDADSVTVKITNTAVVATGGYGMAYRIEQETPEGWEMIPLDFSVPAIAAILEAGQTNTESFSLWQDQHDYTPGRYRLIMTDGAGGVSAEFTLE